MTTLAAQMDALIVPKRLITALFGVLGSLLAAMGMYGLLPYTVARRINEVCIRMALGATQRDGSRRFAGDALRMLCIGLAIGVPMTGVDDLQRACCQDCRRKPGPDRFLRDREDCRTAAGGLCAPRVDLMEALRCG
jgi:hypothetical protein